IRQRPAEAEDRAVPGHWEGDLLTGGNDTHIATLIERHSRLAGASASLSLRSRNLLYWSSFLARTTPVDAALAKHVRKLPEQLRRSLAWDQGKEMQLVQSGPAVAITAAPDSGT